MSKLERYLVPLLGLAIIFLGFAPDLMGFGGHGLGKYQLTMICHIIQLKGGYFESWSTPFIA